MYIEAWAAATVSAASLLARGRVGMGLRTIGIARFTGWRGSRPRGRSDERETESRRTPAAAGDDFGSSAAAACGAAGGLVCRYVATRAVLATITTARVIRTQMGAPAARCITDDRGKAGFLRRRASRGRSGVTTHTEVRFWQDGAGGR
ncbi:hypothetical protein GCM10023350_24790 [Nocardioides endophyticus]|uniref:Uncharacterized protein n=1 Tax=Nocardioides endophyticus TaxID=1353775 RepID=A0ABP8YW51_9ACTN